jgi:hypothetical protein
VEDGMDDGDGGERRGSEGEIVLDVLFCNILVSSITDMQEAVDLNIHTGITRSHETVLSSTIATVSRVEAFSKGFENEPPAAPKV